MTEKYFDISPAISEKLGVFPGDTPFSLQGLKSYEQGDTYRLSRLTTTLHLGAHTDAPSHYARDGKTISECSLNAYLGPCQVIDVSQVRAVAGRGQRVYPCDLTKNGMTISIRAKRVLLKTLSFPDPNQWNDDFSACSPELIHYLAEQGVILIGIDTPSVDPIIVLDRVPAGLYSLVALPLPILKGDASPVRAILLPSDFQMGNEL
jgi:arylformamidase